MINKDLSELGGSICVQHLEDVMPLSNYLDFLNFRARLGEQRKALCENARTSQASLLNSLGDEVIGFLVDGNTELAEQGMKDIERYKYQYQDYIPGIRLRYNRVQRMNKICGCEQARKILLSMDYEARLAQIDALERDFEEPNKELALQDGNHLSNIEKNLREKTLDAHKDAKTIVHDELRDWFVDWAKDALQQGQIDQAAAYFVKRICFGHDESSESLKQDFETIIRTMKDTGQLDSFCAKLVERVQKYNETADSEKIAKGMINISSIMDMVANVKSSVK
jgi:hypothetical protein